MKQNKKDFKGIALLCMAQQEYSEADKYHDSLKEYLMTNYKADESEIDNYLWEFIIEGGDFEELIKRILKKK